MKTLFTKFASLLFIACWLNHLAYAQTWQTLGQTPSRNIDIEDLALDAAGTPFVACTELINDQVRATVIKYDGSSWVDVGTPGFSAGAVLGISIALDATGTPFVAFMDAANAYKATVMKYDGNSWVTVGAAGFSAGAAWPCSIALDASGTPFVAYGDDANRQRATVMKYDGSSWVEVGEAGFSAGAADFSSLAVDASGVPFVAFSDQDLNYKATVMKYDGSNWVHVGPAGFSAGEALLTSLALDAHGVPAVAFRDGSNAGKATVMKYSGSSWVEIGEVGFSTGTVTSLNLSLNAIGNPFVAYKDVENEGKVVVMQHNGSNWVNVGPAGFSAGQVGNTSLALDASGVPFFAFDNYDGDNYKATVMKLVMPPLAITTQPVASTIKGGANESFTVAATGADLMYQWQEKGAGGDFTDISDGGVYSGATSPTLTITKAPVSMNGNQYRAQVSSNAVVTSDVVTLTVDAPAFSNGRTWQRLGETGTPYFLTSSASIAVDANGVPYAVYSDKTNGGEVLTVKKLNGTSWETVGTAGFSSAQVYTARIVLDANGVPFVAFVDKANANKMTVMKFNGTNWVTVGNAGFSAGRTSRPSLVIDASGIPFVAYADGANGGKTTVKKYTGGNWVDVGAAGFSPEAADEPKLALDASGTPYVVYMNGWGRANVMKYTGNSWANVGSTGFSAGEMGAFSLAVDGNGTPYIAYEDRANGGKGTVKRFNGSSWVDVGASGFSDESAQYTSLAIDASGVPFVAYADWANGGRATVRRYDGSDWVDVGTAGFSNDWTQFFNLALDADGTPFVSFRDHGNSFATVMKFAVAKPTAVGTANCGPGAVVLTAAGTADGNYRWYTTPTGGGAIANATDANFTTPVLTTTTSYYVSAVSGAFESERTAVTATINILPSAPTVTADLSFCQGSTSTTLTAMGSSLKWYTTATGGVALTTAPTPVTSTLGATDYYVSQTVDGCESQRAKTTVTIAAAPTVTLAAFTNTQCSTSTSYALTGGQPAGGVYSGIGVSNGFFNATAAGVGIHTISYTYTVNGCAATATQEVIVSTCTGLQESEIASRLSLYPNPTRDKLQLVLSLPERTAIELRLLDAKGQLVLKQNYSWMSGEFSQMLLLRDKAPGVYLLQLLTDDEVITKRIIIE